MGGRSRMVSSLCHGRERTQKENHGRKNICVCGGVEWGRNGMNEYNDNKPGKRQKEWSEGVAEPALDKRKDQQKRGQISAASRRKEEVVVTCQALGQKNLTGGRQLGSQVQWEEVKVRARKGGVEQRLRAESIIRTPVHCSTPLRFLLATLKPDPRRPTGPACLLPGSRWFYIPIIACRRINVVETHTFHLLQNAFEISLLLYKQTYLKTVTLADRSTLNGNFNYFRKKAKLF